MDFPAEAFLEVTDGAGTRRVALADSAAYQIGRDEGNAIVLRDSQVSRRHAMVQKAADGRVYLTDLGSRNGTWLNRKRVTAPTVLGEGDLVMIGSSRLLFHGGAPEAKEAEWDSGATMVEIKNNLITVLVVDIRDFTPLSRKLSEDRLSELVSTFMGDAGKVLDREGAWGQKYIGDAVMAIWIHPADELRLAELLAVFRSLAAIAAIAASLQARLGLESEIRVGAGINTGMACIGNMGSHSSADYTALSDAVNMAFRLETASKEIEGDVALGASVYQFLEREAEAGPLFKHYEMNLKGYREPKPVHGIRHGQVPELIQRVEQALAKGGVKTVPGLPGGEVQS